MSAFSRAATSVPRNTRFSGCAATPITRAPKPESHCRRKYSTSASSGMDGLAASARQDGILARRKRINKSETESLTSSYSSS